MKRAAEPRLGKRMQHAIIELTERVRQRYPEATFRVARNIEEPRHVHLIVTVDVDDTDAVLDTVIDRVLELRLDDGLPVHVIPVRPAGHLRSHPRPPSATPLVTAPVI